MHLKENKLKSVNAKIHKCLAKGGGVGVYSTWQMRNRKMSRLVCPLQKIYIFKNQSKTEIKKINERQTVNFLYLFFFNIMTKPLHTP